MTITQNAPDLRSALESAFDKTIARLERERSAYSSSFPIEDLAIDFADGTTAFAVFKDLSPNAMLEGARTVRPSFLYTPEREIQVYRSLLSTRDLGWPRFYGAAVDPALERYWLFIERVPAPLLSENGNFSAWLEAARWLARFHGAFDAFEPSHAAGVAPELLKYDAAHYWRCLRRAEESAGAILSPIAKSYGQVVATLAELPVRFVHGEFYPSNCLVQRVEQRFRICPVDWEVAGLGTGFLDVAALASGKWQREERLRILDAYVQALPTRLRPRDPIRAFDSCQLHAALQWIGWSQAWSPPAAHAHNWIAEALEAFSNLNR